QPLDQLPQDRGVGRLNNLAQATPRLIFLLLAHFQSGISASDRCHTFVLTYLHFGTPLLDTLFFRRWKPTRVFDQAAQIFDLTGVAGVAVDDAGLVSAVNPIAR
ncbi:MAG: hypothetical protein Q8O70_00890, partial [Burkholderiales bacterium]|nr:hypothetical protein [Burkholderiales bacterium]